MDGAAEALSSLAIELARELGMTLAGFTGGRRFGVFAGADRILNLSAAEDHAAVPAPESPT